MIAIKDGRPELYQWDTGRILTVPQECSQVHFSNKIFGRSVDVDVENGEAKIPDVLLQADKDLEVWGFVGTIENGYTKISKTFTVKKRNKPSKYIFTQVEQTTINELIEEANKAVNTAKGFADDASNSAKAAETAKTKAETAQAGAENEANAAGESARAAAGSEATASDAAKSASDSATAAAGSANAASGSASAASGSASAAAIAADAAEKAQTAAETAQTGAEKAQDEAKKSEQNASDILNRNKEVAVRTPYVGDNGNWYVWDNATGAYVDSGTQAQGPQGDKGDVMYATFEIDVTTGELSMHTPDGYAGPMFAINNVGELEVIVNA